MTFECTSGGITGLQLRSVIYRSFQTLAKRILIIIDGVDSRDIKNGVYSPISSHPVNVVKRVIVVDQFELTWLC